MKTYNCLPQLNKECGKDNCFWNGGECYSTTIKKYSLIGLLEENKRLKSIIKEVREYIGKHIAIFKGGDMLVDMNIDELLEILDKVEENK